MDASRAVPQLSAAEAEEFYASGTEAYPARNQETDSVLIDAPGVRNLRIVEAPVVEPGRPHVAGEVPPPLKGQLREELLCRLMFASRDLAHHSVTSIKIHIDGAKNETIFTCRECKRSAVGATAIHHWRFCRVRRVLTLLEDLFSTVEPRSEEPTSIRKESAPDEASPAGDGIRLAGLFGEPWQYQADAVLNEIRVYDCEGALITRIPKCDQEGLDWANHIVLCVNACAGCIMPGGAQ